MHAVGKLFSSSPDFIKTPKIKPPRLDLRHNTKKQTTPKAPKSPLEKNKDYGEDALMSALEDSVNQKLTNEPSARKVPDLSNLKPKFVAGKSKVRFKGSDWVFTQVTAISSVNLEVDGYTITEETAKYINTNGNSWSTDDLKACYKTMIGAANYKDHISPSEGGKIYGIIVDAVPRKIKTKDAKGFIYYIDVIIATNRHVDPEWALAIERGKIRYVSIGFMCQFLMCSKCGHVYDINGNGICAHCLFELGKQYVSEYGFSRVSARAHDGFVGGIMKFYEISYLSVDPAFVGAAQSYKIDVPSNSYLDIEFDAEALKRPALNKFLKLKQCQVVSQ